MTKWSAEAWRIQLRLFFPWFCLISPRRRSEYNEFFDLSIAEVVVVFDTDKTLSVIILLFSGFHADREMTTQK